jgi:hypothetical protein
MDVLPIGNCIRAYLRKSQLFGFREKPKKFEQRCHCREIGNPFCLFEDHVAQITVFMEVTAYIAF